VDDTVKLALKVGTVPVRFEPQSSEAAWPVKGTMTQRDPEFGSVLDKAEVAALTGLDVEDFDPALPVQIVSTGTAFAIVALRSAEALSRLRVRQDEATAYLRVHGARWFYVLGPTTGPTGSAPSANAPAWRARMQFNGGEDPATGSAAGCAISYLVRHGAVTSGETIHVRQGVEILRPSDLYLSAERSADRISSSENISSSGSQTKVTNVRVGGSTILVATGRIFLP
jgi:trans-2,3-dihydro-3-hydroxyanthranilate isomerase